MPFSYAAIIKRGDSPQTRLIGIGGLKNTARADPRWIKGNAGVLIQLLDSRKFTNMIPISSMIISIP